MLRVGLTGGIGTGKTTVGRMFTEFGCHFTESDSIGHEVFKPGEKVYEAVVQAFGREILAADNTIDRRILGDIVFQDPARRQELNNLVHPEVIRRQKEWLARLESEDPRSVGIVESALMIEVGTYRNYDRLIVVTCSPEVQLHRVLSRSGLKEEDALARIRAQMPLEEKLKFADYVIDTTGSLEETRSQVQDVSSKLRELAADSSDMRRS